jgi:hypothetical protein
MTIQFNALISNFFKWKPEKISVDNKGYLWVVASLNSYLSKINKTETIENFLLGEGVTQSYN